VIQLLGKPSNVCCSTDVTMCIEISHFFCYLDTKQCAALRKYCVCSDNSKLMLYCDRRSVGHLSRCQASICDPPQISLRSLITFRPLRVLYVGRPLWRERESVVLSCCWASSAQSFSGLSPTGLTNIFYWEFYSGYLTGRLYIEYRSVIMGASHGNLPQCFHSFLKSQFILRSVVIHLGECYGEGVLKCLVERPSVGPLRRQQVRDLMGHEDVHLNLRLSYYSYETTFILWIIGADRMAGLSSVFWKQMALRVELLGGWDGCRVQRSTGCLKTYLLQLWYYFSTVNLWGRSDGRCLLGILKADGLESGVARRLGWLQSPT
jgi:hypothetical protein